MNIKLHTSRFFYLLSFYKNSLEKFRQMADSYRSYNQGSELHLSQRLVSCFAFLKSATLTVLFNFFYVKNQKNVKPVVFNKFYIKEEGCSFIVRIKPNIH